MPMKIAVMWHYCILLPVSSSYLWDKLEILFALWILRFWFDFFLKNEKYRTCDFSARLFFFLTIYKPFFPLFESLLNLTRTSHAIDAVSRPGRGGHVLIPGSQQWRTHLWEGRQDGDSQWCVSSLDALQIYAWWCKTHPRYMICVCTVHMHWYM